MFAVLLLGGWWVARATGHTASIVAAVWAPLGVLLALMVYDPIAVTVNETRPCNALHDISVLHCNTDGGFPSIHTVVAAAVAAGLWLVNHRLGLVAVFAAALMAFARGYVGAHYPHDVLAGLALGAGTSLAGYALTGPLLHRLVRHASGTRYASCSPQSPPSPGAALRAPNCSPQARGTSLHHGRHYMEPPVKPTIRSLRGAIACGSPWGCGLCAF